MTGDVSKEMNLKICQDTVTSQIGVNTTLVKGNREMESVTLVQPPFSSNQKMLIVETWHYVEDNFDEVITLTR